MDTISSSNAPSRRRALDSRPQLAGLAAGVLTIAAALTGVADAPGHAATISGAVSQVVVTTHAGKYGTHLTDKAGRTLYLWAADPKNHSECAGACTTYWPPVTGTPQALGAVNPRALATITRADGRKQITYHGHPLYYYAGDSKPGSTNGEASDGFGAKWWLVNPAGKAITTH